MTSWGVTTRLIGGLIMTHSDDDGLVLPPRIASAHLVIIPIIHNPETRGEMLAYCEALSRELSQIHYHGEPVKVIVDSRDMRGGEKSWGWIKKGVPLRLEIGPREKEADSVSLARRDKPHKEMTSVLKAELKAKIPHLLDEIQSHLYQRALAFREKHTVEIDTIQDFNDFFSGKEAEIHGGFALCHWNGDPAIEAKVKEELNVTIRCIPLDGPKEPGRCLFTGEPSPCRVLFAKAY